MIERGIKEARFPTVKSLDSFNFTAIPSLNKTLVLELARCEYIARRENDSRHADFHRDRVFESLGSRRRVGAEFSSPFPADFSSPRR